MKDAISIASSRKTSRRPLALWASVAAAMNWLPCSAMAWPAWRAVPHHQISHHARVHHGHYRAIEKVMENYAVLPIRFSTIAESDQEIIDQVLRPRREEFLRLLHWIPARKAWKSGLPSPTWTPYSRNCCKRVKRFRRSKPPPPRSRRRRLLRPYRDRQDRSDHGQEKRRATAAQISTR